MHTYFKPAEEIRDIGRPISGTTFADLTDALGDGEVIFQLLKRPDHVFYAVLIQAPETFAEFAHLAQRDDFTSDGYFAVPWSDAEDGTDEPVEKWT